MNLSHTLPRPFLIPGSKIWLYVLGILVVLSWLPLQNAHAQDQPNIIFILTDDQRWDALGAAGNSIIHTPEMDKLAADGIRFTEAFVTTPICAASRASIITGLYERTHGFTFGTPPLSKKAVKESYPALLKKAGYSTGFVGKFGMRVKKDHEKKIFDYIQRPAERGRWRGHFYALQDDHSHKHITHEIGDRSREFIDSFSHSGPFCLSISFHAPHADDQFPSQYVYPEDMEPLYQDIEIPVSPLASSAFFDMQYDSVKTGLNYLRWFWRFDSPEKYQEKVKAYYRMISGIDQQLGLIRASLKENNVEKNTIIIFMADNGYFLDERKLAGKWLMYENCLRVPLIIYDPRHTKNGQVSDALALNIDIAPTILELAGIQAPLTMEGINLLTSGKAAASKREYFLAEHLFDHKWIPRSEGIRTKSTKYFRYLDNKDWEEFYDLSSDPLEMKNLIADPNHQDEINRLRRLLESEINRLSVPKN